LGVKSPVKSKQPTSYLHFKLQPNVSHKQSVEKDWNAFVYILEGSLFIGDETTPTEAHHTVLLSRGEDHVDFKAGPNGAHFVLISGQPTNEPIYQ